MWLYFLMTKAWLFLSLFFFYTAEVQTNCFCIHLLWWRRQLFCDLNFFPFSDKQKVYRHFLNYNFEHFTTASRIYHLISYLFIIFVKNQIMLWLLSWNKILNVNELYSRVLWSTSTMAASENFPLSIKMFFSCKN